MTDATQYTIRQARPADVAAMSAAESSAGQLFSGVAGYEWIAQSEGHSESAFGKFIMNGNAWVVTDRENNPAGFILVSNLGAGLHIDELSVAGAHQGQGLGRQLIERVKNVALARGCSTLTLTTFREVAWNRPYYERLGFELCDVSRLPALKAILQKEADYGLQLSDRCAMVYRFF